MPILVKLVDLPDEAKEHEDLLKHVVSLRVSAKEKTDAAKMETEEADTLFTTFVALTGVESIRAEGVGTLTYSKSAGRKSFDQDKAKDLLIKAGVDSDVVLESFKKATKTGQPSFSVRFFPKKVEE
jgi:hypothetical protein